MARSGVIASSPGIVQRTREIVQEDRRLLPAAVFLAAFIPYLLTLAPTISWRNGGIDSGELVTAIATLGIPHPTGYPVYVLLGKLLTLQPFGEAAYRVNLMSAVFAALTASALAVAGRRLMGGSALAAAGGALVFAFSPLFWSRATIAKEYTLHLFLLACAIAMLVEWRASRHTRYLGGFGCSLGLGLGVHLTVLSILPAAIAFAALTDRGVLRRPRDLAMVVGAALPGVLSYAYLPLRAAQGPALNWGDPETLPRFVAHITGSQYQNMLVRLGPAEVVERLLFVLQSLPREFGWPAFVCLLVGLWALGRQDRAFAALAGVVAGLSVFFAAVYPVRDSEVYLLPAYLVAALFVGAGVREVAGEIASNLTPSPPSGPLPLPPSPTGGGGTMKRTRPVPPSLAGKAGARAGARGLGPRAARALALADPAAVAAGLTIVLAALSLFTTFGRVDVSGDRAARDYAVAVLDAVEPNAVVVGDRDEATFALWYVQQVLGRRPDVAIVDSRLIGWDWYRESLARRYPDLGLQGPHPEAARRLLLGESPGRPVFNALPPDIATGRFPNLPVQRARP